MELRSLVGVEVEVVLARPRLSSLHLASHPRMLGFKVPISSLQRLE